MAILVVLILPLPTWLLDVCLAFSLSFSILILMTAVFIRKPLEFSSFPTILLLTTMMRLALNLASTRLILGHGNEGTAASGHVIQAFGKLIMQGNFVIGLIVFAILVIVNFVVITKGSGRIAEVAARFSLDAMPGKQMAIDADLSAGLIDEKEAKQRRKDLEAECNFFGAMDGASKFVRGDAIAGLLIVGINVVGGIIIAVAQKGMSFVDATQTFTLLTVGDGLVSPDAGPDRLHRRRPDGVQGRRRRRHRQGADEPAVLLSPGAGHGRGRDGRRRRAARHADLGVRAACPPAPARSPITPSSARTRAPPRTRRCRPARPMAPPRKSRSPPPWRSICCASNWAMACCR